MSKRHQKEFTSLCVPEEIQRLAKEGWERFWNAYKNSMDEDFKKSPDFEKKMERVRNHYEFLYFTAFEDAINAFVIVVLDDSIHEIKLCVDELGKLSASLDIKKV